MAARAGMLLLEKNGELQRKNEELQGVVEQLQQDYSTLQTKIQVQKTTERRRSLVEMNKLNMETKMLQEQVEMEAKGKADALLQLGAREDKIFELEQQLRNIQSVKIEQNEQFEVISKAGPSQDEHERVVAYLETLQIENNTLMAKVKDLQRTIEILKPQAQEAEDLKDKLLENESISETLQQAVDRIVDEQKEERGLIASLRTMVQTYRRIAESRPFDTEQVALSSVESIREELTQENSDLQRQVDRLTERLNTLKDHEVLQMDENNTDTNTEQLNTTEDEARRYQTEERIKTLAEKLVLAREELYRTKQQWSDAIAAQQELQECNRLAQNEIQSLTAQLQHQMGAPNQQETSTSDSSDWNEDESVHPAPPGDINSPLIKCLLDNWTTDQAKRMALTDWMHNATRGSGKRKPLHLRQLRSDVAAGFTQLLVPMLRVNHGADIVVFRRERREIVTDLILECRSEGSLTTETTFLYG